MLNKYYKKLLQNNISYFNNYLLLDRFEKHQKVLVEEFKAVKNIDKYMKKIEKIPADDWKNEDYFIIKELEELTRIRILWPFIAACILYAYIQSFYRLDSLLIPTLLLLLTAYAVIFFNWKQLQNNFLNLISFIVFTGISYLQLFFIFELIEYINRTTDLQNIYVLFTGLVILLFFIEMLILKVKSYSGLWYRMKLKEIHHFYLKHNTRVEKVAAHK
jgi:hypothetical protein